LRINPKIKKKKAHQKVPQEIEVLFRWAASRNYNA